jgi:DNA-binding NarL/FixJ family response regulator
MAKSTIDRVQDEVADPCKLSHSSEQEPESLWTLQSENQCLRALVVFLSAALLGNMAQDPATDRRALDVLSKQFPGHESLTARERAVLTLIVNGASNKEAAQTLAISSRTVEFHRANILMKLAVKNTAQLVRVVLGE